MREVIAKLAERGTLVAPDAAEALQRAGADRMARAVERLLANPDLPFILERARVELLLADAPPAAASSAPPASASLAPPAAASPAPPASAPPASPASASPAPPRASPAPPASAPLPAPPARGEEIAAGAPAARPAAPAAAQPAEMRVPPPLLPPKAALVSETAKPPAPFTPDLRAGAALLLEPQAGVVDRTLLATAPTLAARQSAYAPKPASDAYAHQFEVLSDVTGNSTCEGAISDFVRVFNDRLSKLRKMLRARREMVGHVPIKNVRQGAQAEIKIIGIVTEVRTTKNGHKLIELEDETGTVALLAPANNPNLLSQAGTVIEDEILGVVCKPAGKGDLLILDRIVRPDVPIQGEKRVSSRASAVAFVSDVHFGSKTFLDEDWERFIRWINGDFGDSRMKALARKVKYLVVNGDIVDGIGIFPGQEDELSIADGTAQYEYAGRELARIRDDVKIFVLPGNHDLVRPAEPQPALPAKYRKFFPENVTQLGNPVKLSIEGVEVLSYHGRSMDDWITRVAGLSYERPIEAMREMVQRRHVCPVYGLRTPIAPEHKDYLVIDTVPDIFVTGHVHSAGIDAYRGVTLINASCWQSQTAYQKMHGFQPDPGKVPVVELDSGKPWMLDFHRGKPAGVDVVGRSALGTPDPKVTPEF